MSQHSLANRLWYELLKRMLQLFVVTFFRAQYSGRENIPAEGPILMVSNHQSNLDPPLVGVGCPRLMNFLARETLFHPKFFDWLFHSVNAIPIDREGLGLGGIKESLRRLKRGEILLIFPEGTRTPDGEIKPFRAGFTTLAVRSGAAILPAAIDGAFGCWPRKQRLPRPGKIRVRYGKPITPAEYQGMDERALVALVESRVRQCWEELRRA
jgi:1-acyl-sn-glycerol-3-phosphate acyltransferase